MSDYKTNNPNAASDVETIFSHATRLTAPIMPDPEGFSGPPKMLVPAGYQLRDLEGWKPLVPEVLTELKSTTDLESFVAYVERFGTERTILLSTDSRAPVLTITACIDYHGKPVPSPLQPDGGLSQQPGWCRHLMTYKAEPSTQWVRWKKVACTTCTQEVFARFLEENLKDVKSPNGADILAIVHTFKVDRNVTYSKAINLNNGNVRFTYNDESKASAGGIKEMEVPEKFRLAMPILRRGQTLEFEARFRYRVDEHGKLSMWVEIPNDDLLMEAANEAGMAHVRKLLPAVPFFIAT